ncbi:MAG TPA: hypothetical protein VGD94_14155 [Vicinamibacterales bacterium]|jgi:hypothetical protein
MHDAATARPIEEVLAEVRALVDRYRARCLWFLEADYYPRSRTEVLRVLDYLERYGDREAFSAAARLRQWLSPTSSDTSAVS